MAFSSRAFLAISLCALVSVIGCSTSPSNAGLREYRAYVDRHLSTQRFFDRGRERVVVKVLPVTPELITLQEAATPGFGIRADGGSTQQFVMAVSVVGREAFGSEDLDLLLNGQKAERLNEISNLNQIETQYPFAYPFHKVFLVSFPGPAVGGGEIEVRTPVGALKVTVDSRGT